MYNNTYDNGGVHIETVGKSRMKMMDSSGAHNETNANWDLEYNNDAYGRGGLEGDVEATENGETTKYRVQMDNQDLAQIFSAPHRQGMLGTRLTNDFQMPRRRRSQQQPFGEMIIIDQDQGQVMDDSLMQLVKAMQQGTRTQGTMQQGTRTQDPNRRRRMQINYSSSPRYKSRNRRMTRRRRLRRRRPSSSSSSIKRQSRGFRSNLPLTEINA